VRPARAARTAGDSGAEEGGAYAGTVTVARPKRTPRDKYAKADPYADIGDGRDIADEDDKPLR
jgi:hypothetical protein